jgi:hypothetical protein
MKRLSLLVTALALAPAPVAACAVCIDSPWGARGFTWPFVVLMAAPFAVVAGLAGVVYGYVWRPRQRRTTPDVDGPS